MINRDTINRARKRLGLRPLDDWRKERRLVTKAKKTSRKLR